MLHVVDPTGSGRPVTPGEVPSLMLIASRCCGMQDVLARQARRYATEIFDLRA